ncbi:MAG TPA: PAS domain-containing protein, partial [Archangium sp.]
MTSPVQPPGNSEQRLTDLLASHAAEALYMVDAQGGVTFANPAAERMFGWSRMELLGQNLHDLVHCKHPDGTPFPMASCPLGQVLSSGQAALDHEDHFIHRNGAFVPVHCSNAPVISQGTIVGAVLVVRDVTARKFAEQARAEQWRHLQFLIDTLPHLAWVTQPDGTCAYVNQRWLEYTGHSLEQSLGSGWTQAIHPEDLARFQERWRRALDTHELFEAEVRMRRASDGAWRWFIIRAHPARDTDGQVLRWVGSCTDVDEQRRYAR